MCSKLTTCFVALLCLSLCVLPCSAEEAPVPREGDYQLEPDVTLLDQAQQNELDLVVPYSTGSSFTITPGREYNTIKFVDSQNNSVTLKNIPVSSYTWNASGGGSVTDAVSIIDFNALSSGSVWDTSSLNLLLNRIESIRQNTYETYTGGVGYWTKNNNTVLNSIFDSMRLGIPALDGHLFTASGIQYYRLFTPGSGPQLSTTPKSDIVAVIGGVASNTGFTASALYNTGLTSFLSSDGILASTSSTNSLLYYFNSSMLGLNTRLSQLSGWMSGTDVFTPLFSLEKYSSVAEDGSVETEKVEYTNLQDFLSALGSSLEQPLSMLQTVLASPDKILLQEQEKENTDQFTDDFTGDGGGAASKDDISDAAGFTSGIKDAFGGNQVSAGDAFGVISNSDNFGFFSQETHDALDTVGPVGISVQDELSDDEFWDQFEVDEDGFYTYKTPSLFDYLNQIRGED